MVAFGNYCWNHQGGRFMSRDPEKSALSLGKKHRWIFRLHVLCRYLCPYHYQGAISAQEIFYLEYFYFIMYLALLWTTVSAILFRNDALRILNYRDNFVSKVIFWPVTLGYLFVVTIVQFY